LLFLQSCGEGLAPFRSPSRGRRWPDPAASEPRCEKENPGSTGHPRDPRKRQADRSDVRQECVRLNKPDPARAAMADGRQPFMPASVSRCLSLNLSL
jgi:hypothetical protein